MDQGMGWSGQRMRWLKQGMGSRRVGGWAGDRKDKTCVVMFLDKFKEFFFKKIGTLAENDTNLR